MALKSSATGQLMDMMNDFDDCGVSVLRFMKNTLKPGQKGLGVSVLHFLEKEVT